MPATTAILLELCAYLLAGGAGAAASALFDALRRLCPAPAEAPASRLQRWGYALLYTPRYVQLLHLVAAPLLLVAAAGLQALLTGQGWPAAAAAALGAADGALVYVIGSQARHALTAKSTRPPWDGAQAISAE